MRVLKINKTSSTSKQGYKMLNRRKFLTSGAGITAVSVISTTPIIADIDTEFILRLPDKTEYYKIVDGFHVLHRDNDLPATIRPNGSQRWYKDGKLHRDNDLPSVIYPDGTKYWHKDGNLHRDSDLPCIIRSDGRKEWWKNGIFIEITN